jgi:hypothetical protein
MARIDMEKPPEPRLVPFRVVQNAHCVLEVEIDGQIYEFTSANLIKGVVFTGYHHPVTGMPLLELRGESLANTVPKRELSH